MGIINKTNGFGYSTIKTKNETLDLSRKVFDLKIKGDFVECGVASGVQIAIMEDVNSRQKIPRKVWAFDSYEGIPLATSKDDQQPGVGYFNNGTASPTKKGNHLKSSGITVHKLDDVKKMLKGWVGGLDNIVFVKGWFEKTVPDSNIKDICLLRLDGDLYESTYVCLENLFPKITKNGYLIIDDWGLPGCRKACDDYFNDYKSIVPLGDMDSKLPMNFVKL